jgi:hypothetical protein
VECVGKGKASAPYEFGVRVAIVTSSMSVPTYDSLKRTAKGASMLDPIASLCEELICPYKKDNRFLYFDYGHFSADGSDLAVKAMRLGMGGELAGERADAAARNAPPTTYDRERGGGTP